MKHGYCHLNIIDRDSIFSVAYKQVLNYHISLVNFLPILCNVFYSVSGKLTLEEEYM